MHNSSIKLSVLIYGYLLILNLMQNFRYKCVLMYCIVLRVAGLTSSRDSGVTHEISFVTNRKVNRKSQESQIKFQV